MTRRNLILIHRGSAYERDFEEIAEKVFGIDNEITTYALGQQVTAELPAATWLWPTLVVALTSDFRLNVKRGTVLKNHQVDKYVQYRMFREAGIPTPPTLPFEFGMRLDPLLFGDFVLIKPLELKVTSTGIGIQLFRRQRLENMLPKDFPSDHAIHKLRDRYLAQRFINTGPYPSFYRVQTFFGKVVYSWHSTLKIPRCGLDASDNEIERTVVASQGGEKQRELVKDPDILRLAEKVHAVFPTVPTLATDVLREESTNALYVLECNPGGNTWHFSSKIGEKLRRGFGNAKEHGAHRANQIARKMFIEQYGAFDIIADILVEKTRGLAS